ncbi:hypothetical protein [Phycicoccus jejuensis]|uniref:hypothetical protein n=1 Tax=Phycicoccus jejuensis TaxID=367299 RepID=UPI0004C3CF9D|nr:hypothetical protein [Phycicoccus jejuensis]
MRAPSTVLVRHDPCHWLPEGGVAEVVLAGSATPPDPVALVRLAVTSPGPDGPALLVTERADGRGPDLPTAVVGDTVGATVRRLAGEVLTGHDPTRLVGWVRNTVPVDAAPYPWPTPVAHFAVWHVVAARDQLRTGRWLPLVETGSVLGERHWWPLLPHVRT